MEPPDKNKVGVGIGRRRSMNPFSSRASASTLAQINTNVGTSSIEEQKKDGNKIVKRGSLFGLGHSAGPDLHSASTMSPMEGESANSPKTRPRTLQKQKTRPSSMFGSLGKRSVQSFDPEDEETEPMASVTQPLGDGGTPTTPRKSVLHHGEVQTTSGMFRKKREYLVLTDTHLIRFKSQSRASDVYPSIITGRSKRHPSTASIGSLQETLSNNSHASADSENRIPLEQIVAAYKVEDGRPYFTTEVVWLEEDEPIVSAGSIQLMLRAPDEADLWISSILGAAQKAKLLMQEPFPERIVRYLVGIVELLNDYDRNCCHLFRVIRRPPLVKGEKGSSDDLSKSGPSVSYLVVGVNYIHMIQLPDFTTSGRPLITKSKNRPHGIVTLVSMEMTESDDRFSLEFRLPLERPNKILLASSATSDIAFYIFRAHQYLKPNWIQYSFAWAGPRRFKELAEAPVDRAKEDLGGFNTTITAYCQGYGCDISNIQYTLNWDVEDAPEFKLLPPARNAKYSTKELLAIMRTLRYNEFFRSISFEGVDLHSLHGTSDSFGTEHVAMSTYDGAPIYSVLEVKTWERSLLYQEVQAIALKSRSLVRMNFGNTLPRRRVRNTSDWGGMLADKDPGCEFIAAILPLCRKTITTVSWIILSGIELGDTDFEDLVPALEAKRSRIRAIECSNCGLSDERIGDLMNKLERQSTNIVGINISENPGRLNLERFQISMSRFSNIRTLNLSKISRTPADVTLFAPEVIGSWRLEELFLSGVPLNEPTLESLSGYLKNDMSNNLRVLELERTNLGGSQVALLLRSMTRVPGEARNLCLNVNDNMLEDGIEKIIDAIKNNQTPSRLFLRMIEFEDESHFRHLLEALQLNTTIQSLDISKASLKYDASPETCDALKSLFIMNTTLEELDISGELTHLEVCRFGSGLNQALTGLSHNKALKVLKIEYQNLGFEGSNALASVLENNQCLTHIYCSHNDIGMQAFTTLVHAMAKNNTVIELPYMIQDQEESTKRMKATMSEMKRDPSRRFSSALGVTKLGQGQEVTQQDIASAVDILREQWDTLGKRLATYLDRNRNIAVGVEEYTPAEEIPRPSPVMSESAILHQVLTHTTPSVELGNPVDDYVNILKGLGIDDGNNPLTQGENREWTDHPNDQAKPKKFFGIPRSEIKVGRIASRTKNMFDLREESPERET